MNLLRLALALVFAASATAQTTVTINNQTRRLQPTVPFIVFPPTAFRMDDTDASHQLIFTNGSNLTANRTLTIKSGDANLEVDFTGAAVGNSLSWNGTKWAPAAGVGSGTVTSVAQSFTGGLISVGGSPITGSGTLALTVAGTSGGIPYFSSGSTWASSGALGAGALLLGGGAGAAPTPLTAGATTEILVGGGAATAPVWTTATGTGAPVRAGSPTFTGTPAVNNTAGTAGNVFTFDRNSIQTLLYHDALSLFGAQSNHSFGLITNGIARLTIDTSGNGTLTGNLTVSGAGTNSFVGLTTINVPLQEHVRLAGRFSHIGGTNYHLTNNAYYNGTNFKRTVGSAAAQRLTLNAGGSLLFANEATGSADDTLNFSTTAFSVDSSGNLLALGTLTAGSAGTVITDSGGKVLSAALNTVAIAQGGTAATTASAAVDSLGGATSVGTGGLARGTSPAITTSITTPSTTFALLNTTATTVNAFGAATTVNTGAAATQIWNFGGSTTASEFRFLEPSGSGTNYSAFKAGAQGASITYTLPAAVGSAGTFLRDAAGDGVLDWAAPAGSGDMVLADVQTVTGAKTFGTIGGAVGKFILAGSTSGSTIVNAAAIAGTTTITLQGTTGTVYSSGGTDVAVADGGTGLSSGTSGGVLAYTASGTLASSAALAANAIVVGGGAGVVPLTRGVEIDSSNNVTGINDLTADTLIITTPIGVASGGTGVATLTAYAPVFGGTTGTGAVQSGTAGTQGQVLVSNGAGVLPAFEALDLADADAVTGLLPAANQAGVVKIAVFSVDGGGSAIATGTVAGTSRIPFACTLTGYSITATAATGTNTIKIWLKATATSIPTISDVINTSGVSLTTGTAVASGTLSDFTDTVYAAGDMARCAVTAVDGTATDLTVTLYGTRL